MDSLVSMMDDLWVVFAMLAYFVIAGMALSVGPLFVDMGANANDKVSFALLPNHTVFLFSAPAITLGVALFAYFGISNVALHAIVPHGLLLLLFLLESLAFLGLKYALHAWAGPLFFQYDSYAHWMVGYIDLQILFGLGLFAQLMVLDYLHAPLQVAMYVVCAWLLICEIALFSKCFGNFFRSFDSILLIIMYFCAFEIIPFVIFWRIVLLVNSCMVLNF